MSRRNVNFIHRLLLAHFILLLFSKCGPVNSNTKTDTVQLISAGKDSLITPVEIPLAFYINNEGKVTDTFNNIPPLSSKLRAFGIAQTFPDGLASLQHINSDSIRLICEFYKAGWPEFKMTDGISPFTTENIKQVFAFTILVDEKKLYASDCDNQLLRFLRYRSTIISMPVKIKNTASGDLTGPSRTFRWDNKIPVRIYENDSIYRTEFDTWMEYWDCGGKADYDPMYPEINLQSLGLIKKSVPVSSDDPLDVKLNRYVYHPEFVFGLIPLDDKKSSIADNLKGKAQKTELTTKEGKKITGTGIDLNGDGHIDAFWFREDYGDKNGSFADLQALNYAWVQRLYLKTDKAWTPVWYMHYDL